MEIHEFRIRNGDIELHGLANDGQVSADLPAILFVPGLWGRAEQFTEILKLLNPRKAYALSLRGRGQSDVPETGYSLNDHSSDIDAFASQLGLDRFLLVTVSAGASYAITYAAENRQTLAGLIVTDYPAISKSYPLEMVHGVRASVKDFEVSETFLRGLQRESRALDLSPELKRISCPVTVFRGGKTGTYLDEGHLDVYRNSLSTVSFGVLPEVAHDPLEAPECFVRALAAAKSVCGKSMPASPCP